MQVAYKLFIREYSLSTSPWELKLVDSTVQQLEAELATMPTPVARKRRPAVADIQGRA